MTQKILLIGGGTGGHIFPLRSLVDELQQRNAEVELVVADAPLDRRIIAENFAGITTHFFRTGKVRRYLDWRNIPDFFRIIGSIVTARRLLAQIQPDVIFFKGGFVGFPFLVAVKFFLRYKGKLYAHESDICTGALTKLTARWADRTFHSFSETDPTPLFYEPKSTFDTRHSKIISPTPLPDKKAENQSQSGKNLLIFGGSQGAKFINELFLSCHDELLQIYQVTLVSGIGKELDITHPNFAQFAFLPADELSQQIQQADLIVSRAGANSLFEIVAAGKPSVIIPLPSVARNHQLKNAQFFAKKNLCHILEERHATPSSFVSQIDNTLGDAELKRALTEANLKNAAHTIAQIIVSQSQ